MGVPKAEPPGISAVAGRGGRGWFSLNGIFCCYLPVAFNGLNGRGRKISDSMCTCSIGAVAVKAGVSSARAVGTGP